MYNLTAEEKSEIKRIAREYDAFYDDVERLALIGKQKYLSEDRLYEFLIFALEWHQEDPIHSVFNNRPEYQNEWAERFLYQREWDSADKKRRNNLNTAHKKVYGSARNEMKGYRAHAPKYYPRKRCHDEISALKNAYKRML